MRFLTSTVLPPPHQRHCNPAQSEGGPPKKSRLYMTILARPLARYADFRRRFLQPITRCMYTVPRLPRFVLLPHPRERSSNYYIEVFSRRYWQSMEAESAAKAEALLLKAARQREREREGDGDGGGGGGNRRSKNLSDKLVGLMSSSSDLSGGGGGGDDDGEMAWGDGDGGGSGSGSGNVSRDEEEDEDLEEEEEEEDVVLENVDPVVDEAVEVAATAVAVAAEAEANGVVNTEISAMQPHKSKDV